MVRICFLLTSVLIAAFFTAGIKAQKMHPEVPYVPTPENVVDKMLEVTEVCPDDIVFDLGCGDGRIVITAAGRYGARGVGIDINPVRIEESLKNAEEANVSEMVEFRQTDLFQSDISSATVVTLYLLTSVNMKLRPKLFNELEPGTRIVSHNYGMNEWKPDYYTELPGRWDSHKVYFWVMPANVSGTWTWNMDTGNGDERCAMTIGQSFQAVEGKATVGNTEYTVAEMLLNGKDLRFVLDREEGKLMFQGTASDNKIEGTVKINHNPGKVQSWLAVRNPLTASEIDE